MKHLFACAGFVLLVLVCFWIVPLTVFYILSPLGMP